MAIISVIGCGWLGLPLAESLVQAGYRVKGSTTSADKLTLLRQKGIDAHLLRLFPEPEGELVTLLEADAIVINIPPKAGPQGDDFHPQQIRHLLAALAETGSSPYLIYVSSTSIYPDLNREVVEQDVVTPDQAASPAFAEAEQRVLAQGNATVLRFGGLLGYERVPGKYVAGKQGLTTGDVPVNYIHRDDGVGIIQAILQNPQPGQTFNVVAPMHPSREAVYRKNCEELGYDLPTFAVPAEPVPFKVVSPEKLQQTITYKYHYPDPLAFYYTR
ncbi:SDR family oxidoreductase [Tellurirhabdus bombi]|uniref:SDR family oxidoreductase n=1 Tax=Tellurirhabdus bombi TaxID=2907205 RepID=UPI001F3912AD|nr:SDR family oxidoreductase [Tellurirhabdus bombi]